MNELLEELSRRKAYILDWENPDISYTGKVTGKSVTQIDITTRSYNLEVIDRDCGELMCFKNDIGKTIFLTREDAEKKLEEIQNDKT